jgi:hypothetical protein
MNDDDDKTFRRPNLAQDNSEKSLKSDRPSKRESMTFGLARVQRTNEALRCASHRSSLSSTMNLIE